MPNILGLWSQIPFRVWFLGPETLNIGYLDPLGHCLSPTSPSLAGLQGPPQVMQRLLVGACGGSFQRKRCPALEVLYGQKRLEHTHTPQKTCVCEHLICRNIYIYRHILVRMFAYVHMHIYIQVGIDRDMDTYACIYICIYMHIHMGRQRHTHMNIQMHFCEVDTLLAPGHWKVSVVFGVSRCATP